MITLAIWQFLCLWLIAISGLVYLVITLPTVMRSESKVEPHTNTQPHYNQNDNNNCHPVTLRESPQQANSKGSQKEENETDDKVAGVHLARIIRRR